MCTCGSTFHDSSEESSFLRSSATLPLTFAPRTKGADIGNVLVMTDRPPQHRATFGEALIEFVDLIAFSANSNAARRRFESATGVSLGRMALELLDRLAAGPATVGALAVMLEVDMTRASRQVAALARAGFVVKTRASAPGDRRQVRIALTEHGIDAMTRWGDSWREQMRRPLEQWPENDILDFEEFLGMLIRRLTPYVTVRPPLPAAVFDCEPSSLESNPVPREVRSPLECCLDNIIILVRFIGSTHFDAALQSAGIELNQLEYLLLRDVEKMGATTVGDITTRLDVPQSAVSRAVQTVRTMGLIYDEPGQDRRIRWLHLSDAGSEISSLVTRSRLHDLEELFTDVSTSAQVQYARLTDQYVQQLLSTADPAASRYL